MAELKIFVDVNDRSSGILKICQENIDKLGVKNGATVEILNEDNKKTTLAVVEVSDLILDFAGQFSKDILDKVNFDGVELLVRATGAVFQSTQKKKKEKKSKAKKKGKKKKQEPVSYTPPPTPRPPPQSSFTPSNEPIPIPTPIQPSAPLPAPTSYTQPTTVPEKSYMPKPTYIPAPTPAPQPKYTPAPTYTPQPTYTPTTKPIYVPEPQLTPMPTPPPQMTPAQQLPTQARPGATNVSATPMSNQININTLKNQKNGVILTAVIDNTIQGGRVQISSSVMQTLGLSQGMLIAWEDPLNRAMGSARVETGMIGATEIRMSLDTKQDTHIQSPQIVVYSTEVRLKKSSQVMLEVHSQPNLGGFCQISSNVQYTLSLQQNDVIAFEDGLTGAIGAARVQISPSVPDKAIYIDSEILEASGIGSFEVSVSKNQRQIIPLQSVSLGLTPISGENMWEIISIARTNVIPLKNWLSGHIIFKGIKLRWKAGNIACSIVDCVPDLTGDILAQITPNTTLSLAPVNLIPFNAILVLDISRSMMARDVLVTNIAPAIEGIKAAMESREIQEFLVNFKEGVYIPRRISAAFAAVLFLSEKVGRGFGEKVSVIRFADESQVLQFGNNIYMDSASGKKGVLEDAARLIVDRIGNAYGQATNMGQAMITARQVLGEFDRINPNQPTMVVLLTDGVPTDGDSFFREIRKFSENPNIVIYIVGLGNPDDGLMNRAASLCGGEYFKPENSGDLLVWYSKRARDLTVKLKAHQG